MKITFLGTGTSQGIPIIGSSHPVCLSTNSKDKRLRVSVLVEWQNFSFVIDCGPDFRQQMLNANVTKIDGIIFTHEHADHTMGLDDIRPFFFRQGDIPLYAQKLNNLDVLVINALRVEAHISHFNLEEALGFINKVKPKRAYLTHISHHLGFHDDVQQKLPNNVFLAYDNLQITI